MFDYGALVTKFMIENIDSKYVKDIDSIIIKYYEYQRNPGFKR